jgi:hypothetical protein
MLGAKGAGKISGLAVGRCFGVYDEESIIYRQNPDKIPERKLNYDELEPYIHKTNYNFEQYPQYQKNVEAALEQRSILGELRRQKVVPRRQRRIYDRPLHDIR